MTGNCDNCGEYSESLMIRDFGIDPVTGYHDTEELCEICREDGTGDEDEQE